jgi:hypothetical protein
MCIGSSHDEYIVHEAQSILGALALAGPPEYGNGGYEISGYGFGLGLAWGRKQKRMEMASADSRTRRMTSLPSPDIKCFPSGKKDLKPTDGCASTANKAIFFRLHIEASLAHAPVSCKVNIFANLLPYQAYRRTRAQ